MWFRRNITITVACVVTECLLSLAPAIVIIYLFFLPDKMTEIWSTLLIVPYLILILNVVFVLISAIANIFVDTKYFVGETKITVLSKDKRTEISYGEISAIAYDFGDLSLRHTKATRLTLVDKEHKQLLSVNNPPILMVHKIKKKCKNIKMDYYHSKRFLYLMSIINGTILLISVLAKLFL
ncbi:MAG: hypothetical protein IKC52_00380 [Clostridia bacterium]|nr:hypothetical protein [Clostridia bacterium]